MRPQRALSGKRSRSLLNKSLILVYERAAQGYSEMGKKGGSATGGGGATEGTESTDDLKEEACPCFACRTDRCRILQCSNLPMQTAAPMRQACQGAYPSTRPAVLQGPT